MTIRLSKELEQFVHDAVRGGGYASEDDVICDALTRLRQALPQHAARPEPLAKRAKPGKPQKPASKDEFHRRLIASGLMSQLPNSAADFEDPDDQLIDIQGEPLSETVIRERR
jgi:Arc/MetJ-type ribon-helix-helix transcriptional regulator